MISCAVLDYHPRRARADAAARYGSIATEMSFPHQVRFSPIATEQRTSGGVSNVPVAVIVAYYKLGTRKYARVL